MPKLVRIYSKASLVKDSQMNGDVKGHSLRPWRGTADRSGVCRFGWDSGLTSQKTTHAEGPKFIFQHSQIKGSPVEGDVKRSGLWKPWRTATSLS